MTEECPQAPVRSVGGFEKSGAGSRPLICAEPVTRDSRGFWRHSLTEAPFADHQAFEAWYAHQCLESRIVLLADDAGYAPGEGAPPPASAESCAEWEPPMPLGEGWFLICIGMSDSDGPAAWWVRRLNNPQQGESATELASNLYRGSEQGYHSQPAQVGGLSASSEHR